MTEKSKETYFKLEDFDYEKYLKKEQEEDINDLSYYGPVELHKGVFYIGQFKNRKRHGRGK